MSNTINISLRDVPPEVKELTLDNFTYKGSSEVVLDLSGVSEEVSRVRNITIDWGDGAEREFYSRQMIFEYRESSIIPEITTGLIGGGVLGAFTHIFIPVTTHITRLTLQVLINYDNGDYKLVQQPITLIQESYYDNIKEFGISNTAIHDDTSLTFANLQSQHNNWTWPVYLTQEENVVGESAVDPFADFNCSLKFSALTAVKNIINPAASYSVGSVISYVLEVSNEGDVDIVGCALIDSLTPLQFDNQTALEFSTGNGIIMSGETVTLLYSYTVTEDDLGILDNTATIVSAALRRPVLSNTVSVDIYQPLQIEKTANSADGGKAGEYLSYTVNVTNPNPVEATGVIISDSLPITVDNVISGDISLLQGTDMPGNTTLSITYEYQITSQDVSGGNLTNTVTLLSDNYSSVTDTVTTTLASLIPLTVVKSSSNVDISIGDSIQYTVSVTNPNATTITGAIISDSLPVGISDVVSGDADLFTGTAIPGYSTATVTYNFTIPESYIGQTVINNTVSVSSQEISEDSFFTLTLPITQLKEYKFIVNTTNQFQDPGPHLSYLKYTDGVGSVDVRTLRSDILVDSVVDEKVDLWEVNNFTYNEPNLDAGKKGQTDIDQFKLPLVSTGEYDFYIYWGDGTSDKITEYNDPNILHTYDTAGEKTVTIYGKIKGWSFNNEGDRLKYLDTLNWGGLDISTPGAFFGCENYTGAYSTANFLDAPNITTTDLSNTFKQCILFNGTVGNWDTSNVTNFSSMFAHCFNFNQDVQTLDVSSSTNLSYMFLYCSRFDRPVSAWDTGNVVSIKSLFDQARTFNQELYQWGENLKLKSLVGDASSAFSNTHKFNQSLSTWSPWVSGLTNMSSMFKRSYLFNGNIENWDVSNVTSFNRMFDCDGGAGAFNIDISGWEPNSCTNYQLMFWSQPAFNQDIGSWSQHFNSNITSTGGMFLGAKSFNQNLDSWGPLLSGVVDMSNMFAGASSFNNGEVLGSNTSSMNTWNISSVNNITGIFSFATSFNQSLSDWGPQLGNITNVDNVFQDAESFNQNLDSWGPYLSGVTTMRSMLAGTSFNNGEPAGASNAPLTTWDVENVEDMTQLFARAQKFNQSVNTWNVRRVETLERTFNDCLVFNQPVDTWGPYLSSVTNMNSTFANAGAFDQPLDNWDIRNVTTMQNFLSSIPGISSQNYSDALVSWSSLPVQLNVQLDSYTTRLNTAAVNTAYDTLTNTYNWTINDLGV